jgi:hypothetical protein
LPTDLFADCGEVFPADRIIEECVKDICRSTTDMEALMCRSLARYARECALMGIIINWRSEDLCRKCDGLLYFCLIEPSPRQRSFHKGS